MAEEKHHCIAANAGKFRQWIASRGGVAVWESVDLSDPLKSWSTPAKTPGGEDTPKPIRKAADRPARIITREEDIIVDVPKEVKRFHVAVRMGSQGMSLKLTDGSSRKVRAAVAKAKEAYGDAWYEFDYDMQEAVIYAPDKSVPLSQWEVGNAAV